MNHGGDILQDPAAKGNNSNTSSNKVKKIVGKIRAHGHSRNRSPNQNNNNHLNHTRGDKNTDRSGKSSCLRLCKHHHCHHRADDSGQLSLNLWTSAYDALRKDAGTTGLVQAYEAIISQELPNDQKQGMNTSLSEHPSERRLELMTTIASSGVKKGLGSKPSQVDESARKILDFAKETIGSFISSYPSASLAWAGFCTLTPLLLDPLLKQEDIKENLLYVTVRISKFMLLSPFLIKENWEDQEDFRNLQGPTRNAIVDLYRKVLEFEMNCVCAAASAWNIAAKNVVDWNGWRAKNAVIQELEDLAGRDIEKYGTQNAKEHLLESPEDMGDIIAAEAGSGQPDGSAGLEHTGRS